MASYSKKKLLLILSKRILLFAEVKTRNSHGVFMQFSNIMKN